MLQILSRCVEDRDVLAMLQRSVQQPAREVAVSASTTVTAKGEMTEADLERVRDESM